MVLMRIRRRYYRAARRYSVHQSALGRQRSAALPRRSEEDKTSLSSSLSQRKKSSSSSIVSLLERNTTQRGILHFASTQPGLERALYKELKDMNFRAELRSEAPIVRSLRLANAGVEFEVLRQRDVYECLVASRTVTRILQLVTRIALNRNENDVYAMVRGAAKWSRIIGPGATFSVRVHGAANRVRIRVKDAICDAIVDDCGMKPIRPRGGYSTADVPIVVHIYSDEMKVYRDCAGRSLHKRGYRGSDRRDEDVEDDEDVGEYRERWMMTSSSSPIHKAQLNECVAAGMLVMSGWGTPVAADVGDDDASYSDYTKYGTRQFWRLVDPMCGSGTLLIEAALMACDIAPGLVSARCRHDNDYACMRWEGFDSRGFDEVMRKYEDRVVLPEDVERKGRHVQCIGNDVHGGSLELVRAAAERAGVASLISTSRGQCSDFVFDADEEQHTPDALRSLVVTNPPWGLRLRSSSSFADDSRAASENGNEAYLISAWKQLGALLKSPQCKGSHARVLSGWTEGSRLLRMRSATNHALTVGNVKCRLLGYDCY